MAKKKELLSPLEFIANLSEDGLDTFDLTVKTVREMTNCTEQEAIRAVMRTIAKTNKDKVDINKDG